MSGPFDGLVAAVTGGASGIGLATAQAFADAGATVVVLDITADSVSAPLHGITADVRSRASLTAAMAEIGERFGGLDVLVNNAGVSAIGTVEDQGDED